MAYSGGYGPGIYPSSPTIPTDPGGYSSWMAQQFGPDWGQQTADFGTGSESRYGPKYQPGLAPGQPIPQNLVGGPGSGSKPWLNPSSWDPRQITQSPIFNKLQNFNGMGPSNQAQQTLSPALGFFNKTLASNDPLGLGQAGAIAEQKGLAGLRQAGESAQAGLNREFGGVNAEASPEGKALARTLIRQNAASGVGGVEQQANAANMAAREANAQFQAGAAGALGNLGLGLGGLATQGQGQGLGALESAGGMESSANIAWSNIMGQLLGRSMQMPSGPPQKLFPGQTEPYPQPGAPGTYQGQQNADPFGLGNATWNADQGAGFPSFNPWGSSGGGPTNQQYPPQSWNQGGTGW